ncbi:class I adenylate-forming enzyme family protein [Streptomyces benahoarensis]|uniref:Acyl--CoA ligase n=1 Tax=Streptomyces benahoarensis TaxID=2595054 RepID=A0A553YYV4_9ACTN|nr:class I adenylate-forming enzyme family protein [Streptomyces benahoarensis]TSB30429.1 acyl--CoA ligase [Streptomyces benahoarensis]TSB34369.1 acyl--CoA ligase [Streptomyces benahoarensis]
MPFPLSASLERFGDSAAMVFDHRTFSYRELSEHVAEWRSHLDSCAISRGQVVTLEGPCSPQTVAGLLALAERGAITVPLNNPPAAKRAEYLDVAEAEVTVTVLPDGSRHTERTGRTAGHPLYARLRQDGRPGLVLFSSGTTGRSKASLLDLEKMLARYAAGGPGRRIMSFLSMDHIGGVNTVLHTLSTGGTVVTVSDRTPDAVLAAVAAHRVQVLPTTPTFLNMVLVSGAAERHDASSLELITYGTEPMPQQTLGWLCRGFPQARLKQTYGLSELGILPTKSRGNGELWMKLGGTGFAHKIADNVLWIRSDMAMLGYLNAPAPFDAEGFFNTEDVVVRDGEWIRVLGRRSEIINVGGEKVYPSEVESVLLEVPGVAEATVSGHPSPVTGMVVRATLLPAGEEDTRDLVSRARRHCRTRLEAYKVPALLTVSTAQQHSDRYKKSRAGLS